MRSLFYISIVALVVLAACKPSEKNYRLAYETAQRQAREGLDEGVYELMQAESLPPMIHVMGDSVRVQRLPLQWYYSPLAVDSGKRILPAAYNVAISVYKMPTNARAHADALADEGYRAVVMQSGVGSYYVMAGCTEALDSAAHLSSEYIKRHENGFVGIPCPIAIQPVR